MVPVQAPNRSRGGLGMRRVLCVPGMQPPQAASRPPYLIPYTHNRSAPGMRRLHRVLTESSCHDACRAPRRLRRVRAPAGRCQGVRACRQRAPQQLVARGQQALLNLRPAAATICVS